MTGALVVGACSSSLSLALDDVVQQDSSVGSCDRVDPPGSDDSWLEPDLSRGRPDSSRASWTGCANCQYRGCRFSPGALWPNGRAYLGHGRNVDRRVRRSIQDPRLGFDALIAFALRAQISSPGSAGSAQAAQGEIPKGLTPRCGRSGAGAKGPCAGAASLRSPPCDNERMNDVTAVLEAKKAELEDQLARISAPPVEPSGISFGKRVGEGTSIAIERIVQVDAHNKLQGTLADVNRALTKLEEESYGSCDKCTTDIARERLEILPWAVLCIACAASR